MLVDEVRSELITSIYEGIGKGLRSISLSMPHRLYVTDKQSKLFEEATSLNPGYRDNIDIPILSLIQNNLESIVHDIGPQVSYIDLGPGYPQKSLIIIDELKRRLINLRYYAVDVSPYFLDRAIFQIQERGIQATRLERRFEDLGPILDCSLTPKGVPRIIFLGLTFNNFPLPEIVDILAEITRPKDVCLVCYQPLDDMNKKELVKPYMGSKIQMFAFEPLRMVGLSNDDVTYRPRLRGHVIETCFVSLHDITWKGITIPRGTEFITAQSYRFSANDVCATLTQKMIITNEYIDEKSHIVLVKLTGREEK